MTEDHSRTPLPELEALLRGGDLPPERRRAVEAELDRRYAEKWRSSAGPGPQAGHRPPEPPPGWQVQPPPPQAGPLPPQVGQPPPGPPPHRPAWVPPGRAPVTPARTSGLAKPLGYVAAVLVAVVVAVVIAVVIDSGSSPSPTIGTVCVTQLGTCPMADSLPVGASCFCRTPNGDVGGVVD